MDDDEAKKGPEPQIVVQASGDLVPFELLLTASSSDERRTISGTVEKDRSEQPRCRPSLNCAQASIARQRGFTLIEVLVALVVVAV